MWDFKLNNFCNHRIINEKLDIKGEYPNYYAILKRPVFGNNFKLKIVDQNNIYSTNPTLIKYVLSDDLKHIRFNFNDVDVDVRKEVYPKNTYYATYSTDNGHCPKCIYSTKKTNDIYINVLGKPNLTSGLELLIQKVKKALITAIESNVFDNTYGTELPNLVGKPQTALTLLKAQSTITAAIEKIQQEQSLNYDLIPDDEKLLKMDNFQINPSDNPKNLVISFEIYTLSDQNINIGVTI
jgi:hypothetical protein